MNALVRRRRARTYPRMLHNFVEFKGVIEETVGNHSTGRNGRMGAVIESREVGATDLL